MQPDFAKAVDPVFLATLKLLQRIEGGERIITADERATLVRKIEEAEDALGKRQEWILAKYALVSWIDESLQGLKWQERDWWKDNCLEHKFFSSRERHVDFFVKAIESSQLPTKNALEVFYLAVILGFRGFYGNHSTQYRDEIVAKLRVPRSIEDWCRETSRSLHLGLGRPEITSAIQAGESARPLHGKNSFLLFSMLSMVLVSIAIAVYIGLRG